MPLDAPYTTHATLAVIVSPLHVNIVLLKCYLTRMMIGILVHIK